MPTRDIKTKVTLEGAKEYSAGVKTCNDSLKTYRSELKLAEATYKDNANSMEALSKKGEILQKMYDAQSQKVGTLNKALSEAKSLQSGYAEQVEQARASLKRAQEEMAAYADSSEKSAEEQERLQTALDKAQKELQDSEQSYQKSTELVNKYQTQVNHASAELIEMDGDLQKNKKYLDEASRSADGCAQSIDQYGASVEEAGDGSSQFSDLASAAFSRLSGALSASAIIAGVKELAEGLWNCARGAAVFADDILTLSVQTGLSTDTLQEFRYMEDLVDTDLNTITGSMAKMINNIDTATKGTGEAYDAFKRLRVELYDANGELRSAEDIWYDTIDALGRMRNETDRDATAMDIFGKSARDLNPLIAQGSEGLRRFADEAHEVGYVLSGETLDSLGQFDDEMQRVRKSWEALKNQIGAGGLESFVTNFNLYSEGGEAFAAALQRAADASSAEAEAAAAATEAEAARMEQEAADIEAIDAYQAKLVELQEAWQAEWDQIRANIETQISLFEQMDVQVDTSVEKMISSLKSQSDYMATYAANLQKAAELGIDKGLLKKLSDGTVESAEYLAAIVADGGEKMDELNAAFRTVEEGKDDFATILQDASSELKSEMAGMVSEVARAVNQMDQRGAAYAAGVNTMQGYVNGINSMQSAVVAANVRVAQAGMTATKNTTRQRSPSKAYEEIAKLDVQGIVVGVEKNAPDAARAFSDAAKANIAAYNEQIARSALSGIDAAVNRFSGRVSRASAAAGPTTNITNNYPQSPQRAAGGVVRVESVLNLDGRVLAKSVRDVELSTASRFGR